MISKLTAGILSKVPGISICRLEIYFLKAESTNQLKLSGYVEV